LSVSGTWSGTLQFQAQAGDGNWINTIAFELGNGTGVYGVTSNTNPLICQVGGFQQFRVTAIAWSSGTASITLNANTGVNATQVFNYYPASLLTTSNVADINGSGITSSTSNNHRGLDVTITSPIIPTYRAATGTWTIPATPTDMVTIQGSATKTIKILNITLMASQTTAGANSFFLIRRSAANTGGTASTVSAGSMAAANAGATAVVKFYTVNPTGLGAANGTLDIAYLNTAAPGGAILPYQWILDSNLGQPIILSGTSDFLALNFNGATLPSGLKVALTIEWSEE
jgi:hypothetical protein